MKGYIFLKHLTVILKYFFSIPISISIILNNLYVTLNTKENETKDLDEIYEDYLDGIRLFTHIDQERINNLTKEKKEKIKKLELNLF